MSSPTEKARVQRLERLKATLERRLDNPDAALDVLISELAAGEAQTARWEQLHAAAVRDGKDQELAGAYVKIASNRRMQQLDARTQAELLLHAADFYQGILGDAAGSENFLERVMYVLPGHPEAFARLHRRFSALTDPRRLIDLYSLVAAAPPAAAGDIASTVVNKIVPLAATAPLAGDACERLVVLAPRHPTLLDVLEAHCRKTKRLPLACTILEKALAAPDLPARTATEVRRRLVALYVVDAVAPADAIGHVENLLEELPADPEARAAAEKLLSSRPVAARAAAALQKARRRGRGSEPPRRAP